MRFKLNGMKEGPMFNNFSYGLKQIKDHTLAWTAVFFSSLIIISTSAYPVVDSYVSGSAGTMDRYVKFQKLSMEMNSYALKFPGKLGIIIKDLQTRQSIEINAQTMFPSASLVKIPIMAAYFQARKEGLLSFSDELTIEKKFKSRPKTHFYRMKNGRKASIKDLIEAMITESDNTATNMLVEHIGFIYLNRKFKKFGLSKTNILRGVMDLRKRDKGIENVTSPKDMEMLLEKIYKGDLVDTKSSREMLEILKRQKINDRIPFMLPGSIVVAHKTGMLHNAISDVGIVYTKKGDFIICVLVSDVSKRRAKKAIRRIARHAYDACYCQEKQG